MSYNRIAALAIAGVVAAVALAVGGVDWLGTGTALQPAAVDPRLPPRPAVVMAMDEIERPPPDESNRAESTTRDLPPQADVLSLVRAADARRAAMEAIAALADVPGQDAESALADAALSHAEIAVREEAVHALGERDGAVTLQTLQQALQDTSPRVRAAAIRALVDTGANEAVLMLGSALGAGDASMRADAVDALGEIGGPDAARYLEQMLRDENDVVREAAAEWLAERDVQRNPFR